MRIEKIVSKQDGLHLEMAMLEHENPKGIIQISHGMAEHKERYYDFMHYLNQNGYVVVIHDHRGHGQSVKSKGDYGYFYTEDIHYIVEDLYQVTQYVQSLYPNLDVTLFAHSMGTLVARCYLKKYDDQIQRLILSGPPTQNSAASLGLLLAKVLKPFYKEKKENKVLNSMAFSGYGDGYGWLSQNEKNVKDYEADELCGFLFTTNGFINLFQLMIESFNAKNWNVKNKDLPICLMAGQKDPVIQNEKKFEELKQFLKSVGYSRVMSILYPNLKHEILNENENQRVYKDVLSFIEKEKLDS